VNVYHFRQTGKDCIIGISYEQARDLLVRSSGKIPRCACPRGPLAVTAIEEAWCPEPPLKTDTPSVNYR
jgi:hypothetical protein